jgi:uncharacterized GH25 family protein
MFGKSIFISMKRTCTILSFLLFTISIASAQDYILFPENFYPHKGDKVKVHLITANQFIKADEIGFDPSKIQSFSMGGGKKAVDLMTGVKAGDSTVAVKVEKDGLNLVTMTMKAVNDDVERDDFLKILDDEGMTQFSDKAKNGSKDSFREKYIWYLKALLKADDKTSGNDFDKSQGQDFEIVLKDNPYKGNYGDDIIGVVTFQGKPAVNATVLFYVKTADGNVFVQKLSADKTGQVYFKLSREGVYMLRSLHMEASKDRNADYDTWMTTYVFSFTSSNDVPNSYKQFGVGNKH